MCKSVLLIFLFFPLFLRAQLTPVDVMNRYDSVVKNETVYIQTDRPFYEPGEKVFVSIYVLNDFDHSFSSKTEFVKVSLVHPDGSVKEEQLIEFNQKVIITSFDLGTKGGIYKIKLQTNYGKSLKSDQYITRDVQVQTVQKSDVLIDLEFDKLNCNPGDTIVASGRVKRLNGEVVAMRQIEIECLFDGIMNAKYSVVTDASGKFTYTLILPDSIEADFAALNLKLDDDGTIVAKFKPLPFRSGNFDLVLMPEGGWLIEGMESVLAFIGTTDLDETVNVEGIIVDEKGDSVTSFKSLHNGMGKCMFKPLKGKKYKAWARSGSRQIWVDLPLAIQNGVNINVSNLELKKLKVILNSTTESVYHVVLRKADRVIYTHTTVSGLHHEMVFDLDKTTIGIHEVAVFDYKWQLMSIRRVFLRPDRKVKISLNLKDSIFNMNEEVEIKVHLEDEIGNSINGSFVLSIFDRQFSRFAEDNRENIMSGLLLSKEIIGKLDQPAYYFIDLSANRLMHLDLVMLTHAWTRVDWYKDLSTDSVYLKALQFQNYNKVIKGRVLKNFMDKKIGFSQLKLKCMTNGQFINIDSLGYFYIWDIPRVEYLPFKLIYKNVHIQRVNIQPWFSSDLSEFKAKGVKYGVKYSKKDTGSMAMSNSNSGIGIQFKVEDNKEVIILDDRRPIVRPSRNTQNLDLKRTGLRSYTQFAGLSSGVTYTQNGIAGRGTRIDGTAVYIDGIRVSNACSNNYTYSYRDDYLYNRFNVVTFQDYIYRGKTYRSQGDDFFQRNSVHYNTLLYSDEVTTDDNGNATISFYTGNKQASYDCVLDAVCEKGRLGSSNKTFSVRKPFEVYFKTPEVMYSTDKIELPLTVVSQDKYAAYVDIVGQIFFENNRKNSRLLLDSAFILKSMEQRKFYIELSNLEAGIYYVNFIVKHNVNVEYLDYKISVKHNGMPRNVSFSMLEGTQQIEFSSSNNIDATTVDMRLELTQSDEEILFNSISGMIMEPHGCFEQVSSLNYPNLLIYQLMKSRPKTVKMENEQGIRNILQSGYKKLIAYETKEGGFEWYGRTPPNEGLTAYGLLQFYELEKLGLEVDKELNARTIKWLLSRFNKDGSIKINSGMYGFSSADVDVTTAYVTWVLSEISEVDLNLQLKYLEGIKKGKMDAYIQTLMAAIYCNRNQKDKSIQLLMKTLEHIKIKNYKSFESSHSIVRSYGQSLDIEVMGMAAYFAYKLDTFEVGRRKLIGELLKYMNSRNVFGNTQSNIWALKALNCWMIENSKKTNESDVKDFNVSVKINEHELLISNFNLKNRFLDITIPVAYFKKGLNKIDVKAIGLQGMILSAEMNWNEFFVSKESDLILSCKHSGESFKKGSIAQLNYQLINNGASGLPQTVVVIPLAGGLEFVPEQLKMLIDKKYCDYYEIMDGQLLIYFAELGPGEVRNIPVSFKSLFKGEFTISQAKAYLYYQPEVTTFLGNSTIKIE
ncbi:MAG TPA: alpha-2-macroglobulin family protein [Bacteroidia bacterium]